MITHGSRDQVADRLTQLVAPFGIVNPAHQWMPNGFLAPAEAKLGEVPGFLSAGEMTIVTRWWLARPGRANTPNWDIASACSIEGRPGLILVAAKAHARELEPNDWCKAKNRENRDRIGQAIHEANSALNDLKRGGWTLSRDSHCQLCNRWAWTWKVASLGVPAILVYLGFLNAGDVAGRGPTFRSVNDWESALRSYARTVVPEGIWGQPVPVGRSSMRALIRAVDSHWEVSRCSDGGTA